MPQALPLTTKIAPESARQTKYRILKAQYGDGYSQRAPDGLNNKVDSWAITWQNLSAADRDTVLAALDAVGGWDYLTWTPFKESVQKKFIVGDEGYSISYNAGRATIRVQIHQVFDL